MGALSNLAFSRPGVELTEPAAETPDTLVFITNFFDDLRRLTEAE